MAHVSLLQQAPLTQVPSQHRSPRPVAWHSPSEEHGHSPQSTGLPHSSCGPQASAQRRLLAAAPHRLLCRLRRSCLPAASAVGVPSCWAPTSRAPVARIPSRRRRVPGAERRWARVSKSRASMTDPPVKSRQGGGSGCFPRWRWSPGSVCRTCSRARCCTPLRQAQKRFGRDVLRLLSRPERRLPAVRWVRVITGVRDRNMWVGHDRAPSGWWVCAGNSGCCLHRAPGGRGVLSTT